MGKRLRNLDPNELSNLFQDAFILLVLSAMDVPSLLLLMLLNSGYP